MINDFIEYKDSLILYKDGVSSLDYGIRVLNTNILSSPKPDIEHIEIPGRDGSLSVFNGWEDFIFEVECVLIGDEKESMASIARKAKRFLVEGTNCKLQSSEDMDFYLIGSINSKLDLEEVLENFSNNFKVTYRCKPHRYYKNVSTLTVRGNNQATVNIVHDDCKPKFTIKCNGDITITVNDDDLILKGVTDNIVVDCDLMDCYKLETKPYIRMVPQNHLMYSFFPKFVRGTNTISVATSDTNAVVKIDWREVSIY